ncbi:hypothetical protein WJX81_001940 [Elliptochloris bilobata]|uniref:Uncharacterized protein n=1 Tax=Elliptochloris bilobata TaxID=381761 RepID=A0AAW1QK75_9CHLO
MSAALLHCFHKDQLHTFLDALCKLCAQVQHAPHTGLTHSSTMAGQAVRRLRVVGIQVQPGKLANGVASRLSRSVEDMARV